LKSCRAASPLRVDRMPKKRKVIFASGALRFEDLNDDRRFPTARIIGLSGCETALLDD
jgi:hypothetical protein